MGWQLYEGACRAEIYEIGIGLLSQVHIFLAELGGHYHSCAHLHFIVCQQAGEPISL